MHKKPTSANTARPLYVATLALATSTFACGSADPGSAADDVTESKSIMSKEELVLEARNAAAALGLSKEVGSLAAALIYWETGRLKTEAAPAAQPSNNVFAIAEADCLLRTDREDFQRLSEANQAKVTKIFENQTGCTAFGGIGAGTLKRLEEIAERDLPFDLGQRDREFAIAYQSPTDFLKTGSSRQKVFLVVEAMALCEFNVVTFPRLQYWNKGPNWHKVLGELEYANDVLQRSEELGRGVTDDLRKLVRNDVPACVSWAK